MTEHLHFHGLEKEMATHSSILAWRIPGTGEYDVVAQSRTRSDLAAVAAVPYRHFVSPKGRKKLRRIVKKNS